MYRRKYTYIYIYIYTHTSILSHNGMASIKFHMTRQFFAKFFSAEFNENSLIVSPCVTYGQTDRMND